MKIRAMLADDQTLVRQGIRSLLALTDHIEVVAEVADGSEVLDAVQALQPDILLLDMRMPVMNGIQTLQALSEANAMLPCIILTTFDDHQRVLEGMRAGARGYLLKDVSLDSLVHAIECVQAGGTLVQPAITERVLKGLSGMHLPEETENTAEPLSQREVEVLRMMAGGYSNREISLALHKSEGTIKNQVSSILDKLGVRDRTQAVLRAINLGVLSGR